MVADADSIELSVMADLLAAMGRLPDADARARVFRWLSDKIGAPPPARPIIGPATSPSVSPPLGLEFPDLYHAAEPKTDKERAVVGAYWLRLQGAAQFQAAEVNTLLRDLGFKVGNITDALTAAMQDRPALIIQIRKSGASRQSRKSYKITDAGVRWAEARTQGETE